MTAVTEGTGRQWTARQDRDNLALIPPLAEEFSLNGDSGATERARAWALNFRFLLAEGVPACAHGLYLLGSCPGGTCRTNFPQLDHANVWVPWLGEDGTQRPFLLCHPYSTSIASQTVAYGRAHGLDISIYPRPDGWYGHGAV